MTWSTATALPSLGSAPTPSVGTQPAAPASPRRTFRSGLLLGVGIAAPLLIAAAVIAILLGRGDGGNSTSTTAPGDATASSVASTLSDPTVGNAPTESASTALVPSPSLATVLTAPPPVESTAAVTAPVTAPPTVPPTAPPTVPPTSPTLPPTAPPSTPAAQPQSPALRIARVVGNTCVIRDAPRLSGREVSRLRDQDGSSIEILGQASNGWYPVRVGATEGWMFGTFVGPNDSGYRTAQTHDLSGVALLDESGFALGSDNPSGNKVLVVDWSASLYRVILPDGNSAWVDPATVGLLE